MSAAVILGLCIMALVVFSLAEPSPGNAWLKRVITTKINSNCQQCQFQIEKLHVSPLSFSVSAEGVLLSVQGSTSIDAQVDTLQIHFDWRRLMYGQLVVSEVRVARPRVKIVERDEEAHKKDDIASPIAEPIERPFSLSLPALLVRELRVEFGQFTYVHEGNGKQAVLEVNQINGRILDFPTHPGLTPSLTELDAVCVLERSGVGHLHAKFDLLNYQNDDHIEIDLKEMKLQQMDPFFGKEDGIKIEGTLHHAYAALEIRRGLLTGALTANYDGMKLTFHKTRERGVVSSFLSSLVGSLEIAEKRPRGPHDQPEALVHEVRKSDERSVIKFLLAGLKPAAQQILTH